VPDAYHDHDVLKLETVFERETFVRALRESNLGCPEPQEDVTPLQDPETEDLSLAPVKRRESLSSDELRITHRHGYAAHVRLARLSPVS